MKNHLHTGTRSAGCVRAVLWPVLAVLLSVSGPRPAAAQTPEDAEAEQPAPLTTAVVRVVSERVTLPIEDVRYTGQPGTRLELFQEDETRYIAKISTVEYGERLAAFPKRDSRGGGTAWVTKEKLVIFGTSTRSTQAKLTLRPDEVLPVLDQDAQNYFVVLERNGYKVPLTLPKKTAGLKYEEPPPLPAAPTRPASAAPPTPVAVAGPARPATPEPAKPPAPAIEARPRRAVEPPAAPVPDARKQREEDARKLLETDLPADVPDEALSTIIAEPLPTLPPPAAAPISPEPPPAGPAAPADPAPVALPPAATAAPEAPAAVVAPVLPPPAAEPVAPSPTEPPVPAVQPVAMPAASAAPEPTSPPTTRPAAEQPAPPAPSVPAAPVPATGAPPAEATITGQAASASAESPAGKAAPRASPLGRLHGFLVKNTLTFQILLIAVLVEGVLIVRLRRKAKRLESSSAVVETFSAATEGANVDPFQSMQQESGDFAGSLEGFAITELVQFLLNAQETGVLVLKNQADSIIGQLFFRKGEIIDAFYGDERGKEAVLSAFRKSGSMFTFNRKAMGGKHRTVRQATTSLLMEAAAAPSPAPSAAAESPPAG